MKKFIIGIFVGAVLSFAVSAHADQIKSLVGKQVDDQAPVVVDGSELKVQAVIIDGTSYAPVRAIGEAIGKDVDWKEGKVMLSEKTEPVNKNGEVDYSLQTIDRKIKNINALILGKKMDLELVPERIKDIEAHKKEISDLEAELKVWEAKKAELEKTQ